MNEIRDQKNIELLILAVVGILAIIGLLFLFNKTNISGYSSISLDDTWTFLPEYQPGESVYEGVNEDFYIPESQPTTSQQNQQNNVTSSPLGPEIPFQPFPSMSSSPSQPQQPTLTITQPVDQSSQPSNSESWDFLPEYQPGESVYEGVNNDYDSTPIQQQTPQPTTTSSPFPAQPAPPQSSQPSTVSSPVTPVPQVQLSTPTPKPPMSQPIQPSLIPWQPIIPVLQPQTSTLGSDCNFFELVSQNSAIKQICDNSDLLTIVCAPKTINLMNGIWSEFKRENCPKGCELVNDKAGCKIATLVMSDQEACPNGGRINNYYNSPTSAENCVSNPWGIKFSKLFVWNDYSNEWEDGPLDLFGASNSCINDLNLQKSYCGNIVSTNPKAKYLCSKIESCKVGTQCKKRDLTQNELDAQGCVMYLTQDKCSVSECV